MMNKMKTRFGAWKVLAALPVAAVLLMVGCKPATQNAEEAIEVENVVVDDEQPEVYNVVEVDPEFPGGIEALYKYLAENITYPQQAKDSGIQGRVYVTFVVEKDGSITGAKVLRGIGGGCDEEALRVVNAMPKWTPGKQLGEPVRVQFNLPVVFKLK
jgi:protein TonB